MERFVQAIGAGGMALVGGLWLLTLFAPRQAMWLIGLGLVVVGVGGLIWGILTELS